MCNQIGQSFGQTGLKIDLDSTKLGNRSLQVIGLSKGSLERKLRGSEFGSSEDGPGGCDGGGTDDESGTEEEA